MMIKKSILIFVISILSFNAIGAEIKILYKINDEVITTIDVKNESNYLKTLNQNLENFPKKELMETAIQSLIREKIKKEIDKFFEIDYDKAVNSDSLKNIIKNFYLNLNFNSEKVFLNILKEIM